MLKPIEDLWNAERLPGVLLQDVLPIGELHARLFGEREEEEYLKRGGAVYAHGYKVANRNVVDGADSEAYKKSSSGVRGMWRDFWSRSRREVRRALEVAAFLIPPLRMGFPTAVPRSARVPSLLGRERVSSGPERVTAMAFHPVRPLLALAIDEGSEKGRTRVVIVDVRENSRDLLARSTVLTHAFQKKVSVLEWKPHAEDVLAVGCEGGVLVWLLNADGDRKEEVIIHGHHRGERVASPHLPSPAPPGVSSPHTAPRSLSNGAMCLFYAYMSEVPVTTLSFSHKVPRTPYSGRFLCCGSRLCSTLTLVDINARPCDTGRCSMTLAGGVDGGTEQVLFAEDNSYVLSFTCGHSSLSFVSLRLDPTVKAEGRVRVSTPFPVLEGQPATGVGPHAYFLHVARVEGVVVGMLDVTRCEFQILSLISTGVVRGIGGCVRRFAASRRRLWVSTETGHLLFCDYHYYQHERTRRLSVIPVGVTTMDTSLMASYSGFSVGSLVAVVEQNEVLHLLPSYHA